MPDRRTMRLAERGKDENAARRQLSSLKAREDLCSERRHLREMLARTGLEDNGAADEAPALSDSDTTDLPISATGILPLGIVRGGHG